MEHVGRIPMVHHLNLSSMTLRVSRISTKTDCNSLNRCLESAADGKHMVCSGTVVDHVDEKTWILTSASLVRKPRTLKHMNLGMLRFK